MPKLGSSRQQGVVMFFQAWSSRTTGAWSKLCSNLVSFWLLFSKLNPASFMAKHTTETPAHRKLQKLQDSSFTGKLQPRLVPGVAEVCAVYFSFFYKAKPIHFAWRPGIDLEWGHWSESFAADLTCETSVTLAFISDRHSSFHLPKCQCTPNKGSVNHCHSSAQIVNLWIQAAIVHHVTCKSAHPRNGYTLVQAIGPLHFYADQSKAYLAFYKGICLQKMLDALLSPWQLPLVVLWYQL